MPLHLDQVGPRGDPSAFCGQQPEEVQGHALVVYEPCAPQEKMPQIWVNWRGAQAGNERGLSFVAGMSA